ncbi:conserved protein of unknown function (plasmid) [Rhodovastum atsumiense]|uniref:Uncharacterized protein n=1 Tax=Rhodovastum atsumiense TaxID=504468 RepID=A0A5M6IUC9_9PROT|nr:hypothetical protein [Rhodovastum atsumiense]KAA5611549.1 hypothetical protein F1189_13365 [Rhodovastum atsumiense]CAH2606224.1 conserved protein of unknown function [Rhodovastum atsumiense]
MVLNLRPVEGADDPPQDGTADELRALRARAEAAEEQVAEAMERIAHLSDQRAILIVGVIAVFLSMFLTPLIMMVAL